MKDELRKDGAHIDGVYYCPHHPDENCGCRKPKPELVLRATRDYDIDLDQSFVIGDLQMDVELRKAVACKAVLLGNCPTGDISEAKPDILATDLLDGVQKMLRPRSVR